MNKIKILIPSIAMCLASGIKAENLALNAYDSSPSGSYRNLIVTGDLDGCGAPAPGAGDPSTSLRCAFGTTEPGTVGKLVVYGRTHGASDRTSLVISDTDNQQASNLIFNQWPEAYWHLGYRIMACGSASTTCSTTPAGSLHIVGGITLQTRSASETAPSSKMTLHTTWSGPLATDNSTNVGIPTINNTLLLNVDATAHFRGASGITGLYVEPSGAVGIKTTNPTSTLNVAGHIRTDTSYSFNAGGAAMLPNGANAIKFQTYSSIFNGLYINSNGMGIRTDNGSWGLRILGPARANAWDIYSSKKYKKDIIPLSPQNYKSILEEIKKMDLVYFRFKNQENDSPKNLGVIAEDAPAQIVDTKRETVSLSQASAFTLAGVKALTQEIEWLEDSLRQKRETNHWLRQHIETLEKKVNKRKNSK